MHSSLLELLADPIHKTPLTLEIHDQNQNGEIQTGILRNSDQQSYHITNSIPRFVISEDSGQQQTQASFGFKWQQESSYNSEEGRTFSQAWVADKYGFASIEQMREYFSEKVYILDAGCGSDYTSSLWLNEAWQHGKSPQPQWVGMDISAAIDVAQKSLQNIPGTAFVQGDVFFTPFKPTCFDAIFSEGVLHHTPSTEIALKSLIPLLKPGGEILFYVYRKKGAIREFTDDYIRDLIAAIPPQDAWEMLRPLTKLGQALADLEVTVDIPEDIPWLGINAGKQDIQRFFYWNVAKTFWNNNFSFEENHHINFDWYHPRYAHRQTREEIQKWCDESGLVVHHFHEQESGYTVRATRG